MVQQLATKTSDTLPPAADGSLDVCDQDCTEAAVFAYRWDWGATGKCCATHATVLQQTSANLNRSIALHPIQRSAPAPLLRDERTQLVAKSLVLEAELEEAKVRGLEVYRRNGDLQVQLNTAVVKERELRAQLEDARQKLNDVQVQNDRLQSENGSLLVEVERLRALETFVAERAERERDDGGEPGNDPHVVG